MKQARLMWWLVLCNFCLLGFIAIMLGCFAKPSNYFRLGPHDTLSIAGFYVDTWTKYWSFQAFLLCFQVTDTLMQDIANPILSFNIYNPDKTNITDFTRLELQLVSQSFWFINGIKTMLTVVLSVTQIDLALSKVVYSELTGALIIHVLLGKKTFDADSIVAV